jgi:ribosomal protein RSM22 (predicted rRNA methylase)
MPKSFVDHLKSSTFIDLGSGPGTFSLAYREFAGESKKILQIESSATMREQARKIWDGFYAGETILQAENAKIIPEGEKFLLFGHSANEMGPAQALRYINEIRPDHILFIEPGTKDFFPQMLKIRDELIADGFQILFPCPHSSSCPLASSDNDWCHQFIHIRQNSEIERISQLVKKDRRHLPLTVHAYSRHDLKNESSVRVIRVFPETKFSFEWEVCELNVVKRYQIMKRGLSRSALKQLEGVLSGASLVVDVEKELENALRVKVKTLNNVPLLA